MKIDIVRVGYLSENCYIVSNNDKCLVIGLGNDKSTPDSLGPLVINGIIVTNHFFSLGINVEDGFRSVAAISPGVMGQTGIETFDIVKSIVDEIKPDFLLVIDSLKAHSVDRINKTIVHCTCGSGLKYKNCCGKNS